MCFLGSCAAEKKSHDVIVGLGLGSRGGVWFDLALSVDFCVDISGSREPWFNL